MHMHHCVVWHIPRPPVTRLSCPASLTPCQELLHVTGEKPPEGTLSQLVADLILLGDKDGDGCIRSAAQRFNRVLSWELGCALSLCGLHLQVLVGQTSNAACTRLQAHPAHPVCPLCALTLCILSAHPLQL